MPSEHTPQQGFQLYYSTDGNTYTEVTEIKNVTIPPRERDASDDTALNATVEVSTPGVLQKITQGKFSFWWHKTLYATLLGFHTSATNPLYWRCTAPRLSTEVSANTKWEWQGWIKKVTHNENAVGPGKFMVDFEIERTTVPAMTAGS